MKLYEINNAITELTDQLDFDPETGKIGENFDTVMAQIDALNMERQSVLEWIAKVVLNTRSEAAIGKGREQFPRQLPAGDRGRGAEPCPAQAPRTVSRRLFQDHSGR